MSDEVWGIQIAMLHKRGSQYIQDQLRPLGLGTGLHPYLLALEGGCLHQEALTQILMVDKANTARALAKLEAMGLVARCQDEKDARVKQVTLTPRGVSLLEPIKNALQSWETQLRQGLSPGEVETLGVLLQNRARAATMIMP